MVGCNFDPPRPYQLFPNDGVALRRFLRLRANGVRVAQSVYGPRAVRSSLDAGDGSPRRSHPQRLRKIYGDGRRPRALFTKPNRLGPPVQRKTRKWFGDWIYSRQGRFVRYMNEECENGCETKDAS